MPVRITKLYHCTCDDCGDDLNSRQDRFLTEEEAIEDAITRGAWEDLVGLLYCPQCKDRNGYKAR